MYFASISLVWASRAGVDPKISMTKGTMTHSTTRTALFIHLMFFGLGGRIVLLKIIQTRLVPRVKLKSSPVSLGRL